MPSPEEGPTQKDSTEDGGSILYTVVDGILYTHDPTYGTNHPVKDGVRHAVVGAAVGAGIATLETARVASGALRVGVEVTLRTAEAVHQRLLGGAETIYQLRKR